MKLITAFALALLAGSALQAGDHNGFGFQATVSKPSGDFNGKDWLDGKYGYGAGIHGLLDLGGGFAIVPRFDYNVYKHDQTITGTLGLVSEEAKIQVLSGGADVNLYLSGEASKGIYILGGAGYARAKFERTYTPDAIPGSVAETKGGLYLQAGVGVNFTPNIGLEFRYQELKFKDVETTVLGVTSSKEDISCPTIQASLVLRF